MQKTILLTVMISAFLAIPSCGGGDGPRISVGGDTLSESDIKDDMPKVYESIRKDYNSRILRALQELAIKRMLMKEAESQGVSLKDYKAKLFSDIKAPSEKEVEETYLRLKSHGGLKDQSLKDLAPQISMMIMNQKKEAAFSGKIAALKKKYGYKVQRKISRADITTKDEPVRGNPGARVTVVEFTDFKCGYCMRVQDTTRQLREKYGERVRWVVKDSPFQSGSMDLHQGANCIYQQKPDSYWQLFDKIFDRNRSADLLTSDGIRKTASDLKIDMKKYDACLKEPKVMQEIHEDLKEGREHDVNGTPTFFINGKILVGAAPIGDFEALIDEEL